MRPVSRRAMGRTRAVAIWGHGSPRLLTQGGRGTDSQGGGDLKCRAKRPALWFCFAFRAASLSRATPRSPSASPRLCHCVCMGSVLSFVKRNEIKRGSEAGQERRGRKRGKWRGADFGLSRPHTKLGADRAAWKGDRMRLGLLFRGVPRRRCQRRRRGTPRALWRSRRRPRTAARPRRLLPSRRVLRARDGDSRRRARRAPRERPRAPR